MSIETVAVDFNPTKWALWCDLCDSYIGEPTTDEDTADANEDKHRRYHD